MSVNIQLEVQQQVRGADGSILWSGGQLIGCDYQATSSESTNAFAMGEAAIFDGATTAKGFIPRLETTAAGSTPASDLPGSLAVYIKRTQASAGVDVNFLGVVQGPVGPGKQGLVAGMGSLTTVLTTTATIAIGTLIVGSATAGLCAAAATKAATVPAYGTTLGQCFKSNVTTTDGTGSTSFAGVLVNPA